MFSFIFDFQFGKYRPIFKLIHSLAVTSLWFSSSEVIFISIIVFSVLGFSFGSFLRVSV